MISAVVIVKDGERHLAAVLAALRGGAEIVVLDSGSTDRTVEIARAAGCHHDPPEGGDFTLDSIVQFGCRMASALGFSTAEISGDRFEEVIGMLPESCRQDFPQEPEELRGRLQAVIDALA